MSEANEIVEDFIQAGGVFFIAHRLRRLSDVMVADCERWFAEAGIIAPPRTTSMLYLLETRGPQRVTVIAAALRQFHPVVIDWARKLKKLGFLATTVDPTDRRGTLVSLTESGRREVAKIREAEAAITAAYAALGPETGVSLIDSIAVWETALSQRSLSVRIGQHEARPPV